MSTLLTLNKTYDLVNSQAFLYFNEASFLLSSFVLKCSRSQSKDLIDFLEFVFKVFIHCCAVQFQNNGATVL